MEIKHNNHSGFTFIELLVSLMVLMILVSVSVSNYGTVFGQQALVQKTEHLYHFLRLAQTQAIKDNQQIYVHFCQDGDSWKMVMSDSSAVDSCLLNGEQLTDGKKLLVDEISFVANKVTYKPMRFGINAGTVTLRDSSGSKLSVIQSNIRLRICSPGSAQLGYEQC